MPITDTPSENCTLLKLGGSLLDLPDIDRRLIDFIQQQRIDNPVLLVGGGAAADLVRTWDNRFGLSDDGAHQLAIQAMSLNAQLMVQLNSRFQLLTSVAQLSNCRNRIAVLEPSSILHQLEADNPSLPRSWDVTSDSIAAWLAIRLRMKRLVLLKSADLSPEAARLLTPARADMTTIVEQLVAQELVDRRFGEFSTAITQLAWANLRHKQPKLQYLSSPCPPAAELSE